MNFVKLIRIMIIWIASFPKSGNTWVRAFLSSYFFSEGNDFDLNLLNKIDQFPLLKHFLDIKENPQNLLDASKNWIIMQNKINLSNKITFLKTHHTMCTIGNSPFTNKENTMGAIYLVRDPRDIAVSYSKHDDTNYNITIKSMITEKMQISLPDDKNQKALALIGNWSENYNSWKNFDLTEKIIIKYEDLVLNPFESFFKIIKYLNKLYNLVIDEKKIKKCIELTKFSKLQNLEKKFGFKETISKNELFFRTGKIGQWEKKLNKNDVIKIENTFKKEMVELGYL